MKIAPAFPPGILIFEPTVFEDERGGFFESYNEREFEKQTGRKPHFVQDNHSKSAKNVLRGLHYQIRQPQGKLVRVISGAIFDVAVDIRKSSPTFGKWAGETLSAENLYIRWIPEGFAHGFLVLSEHAEILYKTTDYWAPEHERSILWNDPELSINWPLTGEPPILSKKDRQARRFREAELFE